MLDEEWTRKELFALHCTLLLCPGDSPLSERCTGDALRTFIAIKHAPVSLSSPRRRPTCSSSFTLLAMLLTQTARLAGSRTLMLSRSISSTAARPVSLVTPAELHKLLSSKNEEDHPCVLDASWHMPGSGRQPFQEYRKKRIEGAAFWDVCV